MRSREYSGVDSYFADPLNIRAPFEPGKDTANWSQPQFSTSQVPFRRATSAGIVHDKEEVKLHEEESQISGSFFDFLLQCCSGRNRTQDAQRQEAAETGRPPPPQPINNRDRTFTQTTPTTNLSLPSNGSQSLQSEFQEALRQMDGHSDTESDNESPCLLRSSLEQKNTTVQQQ